MLFSNFNNYVIKLAVSQNQKIIFNQLDGQS